MTASESVLRARKRSLERGARRRQDEDACGPPAGAARTWRAPCQSISSSTKLARAQRIADRLQAGAVEVVEYLGVLEKFAARHHLVGIARAR